MKTFKINGIQIEANNQFEAVKKYKDSTIKDSSLEVDTYFDTDDKAEKLKEANKIAKKYNCKVKRVFFEHGTDVVEYTGSKDALTKLLKGSEYAMDNSEIAYQMKFIKDSTDVEDSKIEDGQASQTTIAVCESVLKELSKLEDKVHDASVGVEDLGAFNTSDALGDAEYYINKTKEALNKAIRFAKNIKDSSDWLQDDTNEQNYVVVLKEKMIYTSTSSHLYRMRNGKLKPCFEKDADKYTEAEANKIVGNSTKLKAVKVK